MNILRVGSITAGGNIILVTTDSGATVYAESGGKVVSGVAVGGVAKLKVKAGTWRVWAELDGQQTSEVEVIVTDSYYKEMSFGMPLSSLAEGALIQLNESGSGVNFYLAKHNYESGLNGGGRELLVRSTIYDNRAWMVSNGKNTYASCSIDTWLNGTYFSLFDSAVKNLIGTTKFYYTPGPGNSQTVSVSTLSRAVFLLSVTEVGYKGIASMTFKGNTEGSLLPIADTLKSLSATWWLRTIPKDNSGNVYAWYGSGYANTSSGSGNSYGSRPAFTLPATAMVNPTPNADGSYTLIV